MMVGDRRRLTARLSPSKRGHIPGAEYATNARQVEPDFISIFELLYSPQLIGDDAEPDFSGARGHSLRELRVRRAGIRRDLAENSERPGPPGRTARVLPAFGV